MTKRSARLLSAFALVVGLISGCMQERSGPGSACPPSHELRSYTRDELLVVEREHSKGRFASKGDRGSGLPGATPEEPRGGELRAKLEDKTIPLPLKHTDVKAQVTLYVGSVTLTQQYHNPYDGKIEAVYVFPLPDDAAVRDFVMVIGDRKIRGVIREREEAQRIYREARQQGHVASLLTQDRPNIFTQAVANIEPGKQIDISITYFHTVRYIEGVYEFHFPMVVGPRYNPAGFKDGVGAVGAGGKSGQKTQVEYLKPNEISAADIALQVDVEAGMPIHEILSPTHEIKVDRGPASARVTLSPNDRIPNRDFVLRWRVGSKTIQGALATWREGGEGYFTLMLQAPEKLEDVPAAPREMIFVLDCSGSMDGQPIALAKRALERCLNRLSPTDTFNVIRFSDTSSSFGPRPVEASPGNVRRALRYVESLNSEGGTEMILGIRAALDFPHAPDRFRIVSFMTDGYIGNDREIIAEVRKRLGPARVFSFGVGSSVNRFLLEGMARAGRGVCTILTLDEAGGKAADELYRRVEHPALADLRIDWGALDVAEVYPAPLPDLLVGRPVVVTGRFKGDGPARVRVSGVAGGQPCEMAIDVNPAAPSLRHPALAAVWARAKIGTLYEQMFLVDEPTELMEAIKQVALRYGLMSDFTAFVAVDSLSKTAGEYGTTVVQPVPVPKGVKYDTTVKDK